MAGRKRTRRRGTVVLRWLALAVILAIGVAYVQPLRAYRDARAQAADRRAEVAALVRENAALERTLATTETDEFVERRARKLGLVRPGERLFIVKGVEKRRR